MEDKRKYLEPNATDLKKGVVKLPCTEIFGGDDNLFNKDVYRRIINYYDKDLKKGEVVFGDWDMNSNIIE